MAINSIMKLDWHFNIPENKLTLTLDDIVYTALSGAKDGVIKTQGKETSTISYDDWPTELQWISDNYSEEVGELIIPPELTDEEAKEFMEVTGCPAYPAWGFRTPYSKDDYEVYDRLARPGWLLQNRDAMLMGDIDRFEGVGIFETDGTNIYKRGWDDEVGTYYNCMPCCVFPNNPGWQLSSEEELREAGFEGMLTLTPGTEPELLAKHFTLP